jgi:O-antigen ligase
VTASLHFLLLPILLAGLAPVRIDAIKVFVRGAQVGAVVGGVIAVIQVWDGIDRAVGGAINAFPFGAIAAWLACVSLIGAGDYGWRGRAFAASAFAAGLIASILSESRGAWLALPVLVVILLVYFYRRYGPRVAWGGAGALAVIAVAVALIAGGSIRERLTDTFAAFEGFEFGRADLNAPDVFSLDQRALMMAYGLEAIADRPILGYGPQNAVTEVRLRAGADGYAIEQYGHLHNEYLTETVGNGIVGLVSLLLLLAAPVVTALRSERDKRYADRMALAAIVSAGAALFGLTSLAFGHDITNTVYAGALLAVCLSAAASGPRRREAEP